MLAFLPAPILFIINFIALTVVTFILACPMLIVALFKWIPSKFVSNVINAVNQTSFKLWVANNALLMRLTNKIEWDIQGQENIPKVKGSCIIISNHLSWTDIVMLNHVYKGKIPITKFFLKHSLIYIPVIGLVCYAIGMPFLRRYSREQLLRNPKLKTKDLNTTRKACLSLLEQPSSLINFVEGTRFTPEKAKKQNSPYRNLMPPKAASLAVALGLIGKDIDYLFNTTLLYPHNTKGNVFLALLCGRMKKVTARLEKIEPIDELVGDYIGDKQFKRSFTSKLRQVWQEKDEQLTQIKLKEGLIPKTDESTKEDADEPIAALANSKDTSVTLQANTKVDADATSLVAEGLQVAENSSVSTSSSMTETADHVAESQHTPNEGGLDTDAANVTNANTTQDAMQTGVQTAVQKEVQESIQDTAEDVKQDLAVENGNTTQDESSAKAKDLTKTVKE